MEPDLRLTCAIHQPNLLPRLSTLAKIASCDVWVVLDDVQFVRRDYQHRARLADLAEPQQWRWLSIETHLPHGRATAIRDAELVDVGKAQRRVRHMVTAVYRSSPHGRVLVDVIDAIDEAFAGSTKLADVAEASTRAMLAALGWSGRIIASSALEARTDRTWRLVDLTRAVGAGTYVCGTGGMTYVDQEAFDASGIELVAFTPFSGEEDRVWMHSRRISALWALADAGPGGVATAVRRAARAHGLVAPLG